MFISILLYFLFKVYADGVWYVGWTVFKNVEWLDMRLFFFFLCKNIIDYLVFEQRTVIKILPSTPMKNLYYLGRKEAIAHFFKGFRYRVKKNSRTSVTLSRQKIFFHIISLNFVRSVSKNYLTSQGETFTRYYLHGEPYILLYHVDSNVARYDLKRVYNRQL